MAAGVRAAAGSVVRVAENVASKVRSLLHFSVPDEGPLSDADTYMPDFMKLLASGIRKNSGGLVDQVEMLAQKVREGVSMIGLDELPWPELPRFPRGIMNMPQAAVAGLGGAVTTNNRTTNLGGVHITVNGYNARNDNELAQIVADKINEMIDQDDSVYK